ncbi:5-formyltetrahydrofolate cyclo-ligase [Marinospirillum celere]|uniref:5-formyltetrahydrofolate cyclo-ligase n=1 Tax=Marinospirillum celere TaxID=1122252 RepID=A0A1I1I8C6_9GAMM|nr:5-formyltetrahydrofolate cyclo-ligase [Marinospirillum celere]SFC32301.1 5-formyltetrahydrofolate cyclo-ligase [Marinospirillum celere]
MSFFPLPSSTDRQALRQQLRRRRRALSPQEQTQAAVGLAQQLSQTAAFINAKSLAVYLPSDGEIDPYPLVQRALSLSKKVYLPVLHPSLPRLLWFVRWQPGQTPMDCNRFGIAEPKLKGYGLKAVHRIQPWAVDLVLMPLVGFDRQGGRLGMGGGFYDRTFDISRSRPRRPLLLGLAHACQEVDSLPQASWDVPMDGLATASALYWTRT